MLRSMLSLHAVLFGLVWYNFRYQVGIRNQGGRVWRSGWNDVPIVGIWYAKLVNSGIGMKE